MQLTAAQLAKCTGATLARATEYLPHINAAAARYGIDKPLHLAAWLAQIGVESGGLRRVEEGLTYTTTARLQTVWPARFKTAEAARLYVNNPEALANLVYGNRMGNTQPGDGWRYRGRGLKQLTGKSNYVAYAMAADVDCIEHPELLTQPKHAADSAGWFWKENGCAALADKRDWTALTKRINGGTTGLQERIALTLQALAALGLPA